jgi:hypothetical protein
MTRLVLVHVSEPLNFFGRSVGENHRLMLGKSFGCDFSRFSELLDFSKSCLPKSSAMRNFNKVEFSDAVFGKSGLGSMISTTVVYGSCIGGCCSRSFPWWNCVPLLLLCLKVCLLW